jgi:hypothetical protein
LAQYIQRTAFAITREPDPKVREPHHLADGEAGRRDRKRTVVGRFLQIIERLEIRLGPDGRHFIRSHTGPGIAPGIQDKTQGVGGLRVIQHDGRHLAAVNLAVHGDFILQSHDHGADRICTVDGEPVRFCERRVNAFYAVSGRSMTDRTVSQIMRLPACDRGRQLRVRGPSGAGARRCAHAVSTSGDERERA